MPLVPSASRASASSSLAGCFWVSFTAVLCKAFQSSCLWFPPTLPGAPLEGHSFQDDPLLGPVSRVHILSLGKMSLLTLGDQPARLCPVFSTGVSHLGRSFSPGWIGMAGHPRTYRSKAATHHTFRLFQCESNTHFHARQTLETHAKSSKWALRSLGTRLEAEGKCMLLSPFKWEAEHNS